MKLESFQQKYVRHIEINPVDDVVLRFRELDSGEVKEFSQIVGELRKEGEAAGSLDSRLEELMAATFIGSNIDDGPAWSEIVPVLRKSGDTWLQIGKEFVEKNPLVQRSLSQLKMSES